MKSQLIKTKPFQCPRLSNHLLACGLWLCSARTILRFVQFNIPACMREINDTAWCHPHAQQQFTARAWFTMTIREQNACVRLQVHARTNQTGQRHSFLRTYLRMKTSPVLSTQETNIITAVAHVFNKYTYKDDWPDEANVISFQPKKPTYKAWVLTKHVSFY